MFSVSEPPLNYHIWGPNTYRSHIYADCNHCNTNQPAEKMTILCIRTILLGRHCRGHATCPRPRNWHYTTIFNEQKHFGFQFMHTVTTAMPVNLPEQWPFNECSLYCSANIARVTPNVLGLGPNTIPPYSMTEHIPESHLTVTTAIPINLPKKWPFYACSLSCSANIAGVTPNVLGLGPNTIPPYLVAETIPDSYLCIL